MAERHVVAALVSKRAGMDTANRHNVPGRIGLPETCMDLPAARLAGLLTDPHETT